LISSVPSFPFISQPSGFVEVTFRFILNIVIKTVHLYRFLLIFHLMFSTTECVAPLILHCFLFIYLFIILSRLWVVTIKRRGSDWVPDLFTL
jgi:hypothetical protein